MRRGLLALVGLAGLALPASSAAATLPESFTPSCPTESPDGGSYGGVLICSGTVASFDGAKLDADLTQPSHYAGTSHPLIVMLHGFGSTSLQFPGGVTLVLPTR